MAKAKLLYGHKNVYPDGAIVAIKVWVVPPSPRMPEGYKYSLVYIDPQGKRVLGYDNAEGKGHHRHEGDKETSVSFESIEQMTETFSHEVEAIRRSRHED